METVACTEEKQHLSEVGMLKWQYHVEQFSITERWSARRQADELQRFNQRLNEMGEQGWEMVSYESVPMAGAFTKDVKGYAYLLFFKRQL